MSYPLDPGFSLDFSDLRIVARGLTRPECVLALSDGTLVAAHGGGGYSRIDAHGSVEHTLIRPVGARAYLPNGIAVAQDGRVLFADLGKDVGGIFAIDAAGKVEAILDSLDGQPLPPSNFVLVDSEERLWFTVSTRKRPRSEAWNHRVADGFIGVVDARGARIVADGIGYTNEIAFSPDRQWLYVNETYNQRVSRFPLQAGAVLGRKEVMGEFDGADIPDGLSFDAHGGAWITCIGSNRLVVLRPDGNMQTVLADTDAAFAERLAHKLREGTLSQEDMKTAGHSRLGNISSLAFGGAQLRTAYLGCLLDDCIRAFESPVPGLIPAHWHRRVGSKPAG
jgi:sugar lactone lactonase YvrE